MEQKMSQEYHKQETKDLINSMSQWLTKKKKKKRWAETEDLKFSKEHVYKEKYELMITNRGQGKLKIETKKY